MSLSITVPAPPPHLKIARPTGWPSVNLPEIWAFRDLIWTLAGRDLKLRYRQTALGAIWVVLQPLLAGLIFAFVFGRVAGLPSDGLPYFVFAFAGLIGWQTFSHVLNKTSGSLIGSAALVSKVYFPRMCLPVSMVFSGLIDFAVALAMMVGLLVAYGINPGPAVLLLPVWLGLAVMLALGVGFLTSALSVSYRDVNYIVPVLMQFLLYASPVAYGMTAVTQRVPGPLAFVYHLNPMAAILQGFRWSLLGRGEMEWGWAVYSACACVMTFLAGALVFRKMEQNFADVI